MFYTGTYLGGWGTHGMSLPFWAKVLLFIRKNDLYCNFREGEGGVRQISVCSPPFQNPRHAPGFIGMLDLE